MRCPQCGFQEDKVIDSRTTKEGRAIRRRRECTKCGKRYTTYEYIERAPWSVVKKDGRRERYEREKILTGLIKACEKRSEEREDNEGSPDVHHGLHQQAPRTSNTVLSGIPERVHRRSPFPT